MTLNCSILIRRVTLKTIDTLIEDIHKVFQLPHEFNEERLERFSKRIASSVKYKINLEQGPASLRMSSIGQPCSRKLWYSVNTPNKAETLTVQSRVKFLYGDILEELLLFLAEEAGHTVQGCQDELEINGVKGHRDAVIDGVLVDCKSASTYSFKRFKNGLTKEDDGFGYLTQLQSYLYASRNDPIVTDKNRAAFFVIDKTLGHIHLDLHKFEFSDVEKLYEERKELVKSSTPPPRAYSDVPEGKSGNRKLDYRCAYCGFKQSCWPSLRGFSYFSGPVFLTKVVKEPNVQELTNWQEQENL